MPINPQNEYDEALDRVLRKKYGDRYGAVEAEFMRY